MPVLLLTVVRPVALTGRGSLSCNAGCFKLLSLRMYNCDLLFYTYDQCSAVFASHTMLSVCCHSLPQGASESSAPRW